MIFLGQHHRHAPSEREPTKRDRWLVGLLAGAAVVYLAGKVIGLGQPRPVDSSLPRER